jgi:hypothetical protein
MQDKKQYLFRNFNVESVMNGYILTLNKMQSMVADEVYVFNSLEQLAEFIKDLDNTK